MGCTKAKALRNEMRKLWNLPPENWFNFTGPDWLLLLLANNTKDMTGLLLLTLWSAWHLRCDIVHGKGDNTIASSVNFLKKYSQELILACEFVENAKGKQPVLTSAANLNFECDRGEKFQTI